MRFVVAVAVAVAAVVVRVLFVIPSFVVAVSVVVVPSPSSPRLCVVVVVRHARVTIEKGRQSKMPTSRIELLTFRLLGGRSAN